MCCDEVNRSPWLPAALVEHVRRSAESGGEVGHLAFVALPERTYRVAEAIVPFRPARGKATDLVAARSAVPRFGNELDLTQDRVLTACIQKTATFVEPCRFSAENCRQIETETIDAHLLRPISKGVGHQLKYALMTEIDGVPGTCVVDVIAPVRGQAIIGSVVDTLER